MQLAIASRIESRPGMLAGLLLSSLLAQALAPARASAVTIQGSPRAVSGSFAPPGIGSRIVPADAGSGCAEDITVVGHACAEDIGHIAQAGAEQILMLDAQGATLEEISFVAFRTVQFIVFRAGEGRTEVHAHLQACLASLDGVRGALDQRLAIRAAASAALDGIDAAVDAGVYAVQMAVWVTLER